MAFPIGDFLDKILLVNNILRFKRRALAFEGEPNAAEARARK
jgi:hypothetical protein